MVKIDGKETKLIANIIVGNENPDIFKKCLESIRPYVDMIIVGFNGTDEKIENLLKAYNCRYFKSEWHDNFAEKRIEVWKQTPGESLVLWIDSDDCLIHAEHLKEEIETAFMEENVIGLCVEWYYTYNKDGLCDQKLWRERIVKKDCFEWHERRLHESLSNLVDGRILALHEVKIDQIDKKSTFERQEKRTRRNLEIIKKQYELEQSSGILDPKTIIDLARSYQGCRDFESALKYYKAYLNYPISNDERAYALTFMGNIYRELKDYNSAGRAAIDVMIYCPHIPDGYVDLGTTAYAKEDWGQCITFMEMSFKFKPSDSMPIDPNKYDIRPFSFLAFCYMQFGMAEKAIKAAEYVLKKIPDNKPMQDIIATARRFLAEVSARDGMVALYNEIKQSREKLKHFFLCLPDYAMDDPTLKKAKAEFKK